jgi:hypothetical protein
MGLSLFELKEKAKWARDSQERKLAITGMISHGAVAVSSLEEIFNVSIYEDIRAACIDAIKSISGEPHDAGANHPMELQVSDETATPIQQSGTVSIENAKKRQTDKMQETGLVASEKLADLPP